MFIIYVQDQFRNSKWFIHNIMSYYLLPKAQGYSSTYHYSAARRHRRRRGRSGLVAKGGRTTWLRPEVVAGKIAIGSLSAAHRKSERPSACTAPAAVRCRWTPRGGDGARKTRRTTAAVNRLKWNVLIVLARPLERSNRINI